MNRTPSTASRNLSQVLKCTCFALIFFAASAFASTPQTFRNLVYFNGKNGGTPIYVALVQGTDGNLYGTTYSTIFKMTPNGMLTTLYSFCAEQNCADGNGTVAGLVLGNDGNFYGVASSGGGSISCTSGCGTVFKITPGGTLTTLHSFDLSDGADPEGSLVQGTDGNLYGTTFAGGSNNSCSTGNSVGCGTVFEITTTGVLTTLHNFAGLDGSGPFSPLIQAVDGNFYGTTYAGGKYNSCALPSGNDTCGTIFKITPEGSLTTLHNFKGIDGGNPIGGLVQASNGDLYGTTWEFGEPLGGDCAYTYAWCGTYFKITPAGKLTSLHSFDEGDAGNPSAALILATDGNFYGTSQYGDFYGNIFKISAGNIVTSIEGFNGWGSNLYGGLVQATSGVLYGMTTNCLSFCYGDVFSLNVGLGPFITFVLPAGKAGDTAQILGQNLTRTTSVTFNGAEATSFTVVSDTYLTAVVPSGATSGPVVVTNRSGILTSNKNFTVLK